MSSFHAGGFARKFTPDHRWIPCYWLHGQPHGDWEREPWEGKQRKWLRYFSVFTCLHTFFSVGFGFCCSQGFFCVENPQSTFSFFPRRGCPNQQPDDQRQGGPLRIKEALWWAAWCAKTVTSIWACQIQGGEVQKSCTIRFVDVCMLWFNHMIIQYCLLFTHSIHDLL